jgi:hypothetical protein
LRKHFFVEAISNLNMPSWFLGCSSMVYTSEVLATLGLGLVVTVESKDFPVVNAHRNTQCLVVSENDIIPW